MSPRCAVICHGQPLRSESRKLVAFRKKSPVRPGGLTGDWLRWGSLFYRRLYRLEKNDVFRMQRAIVHGRDRCLRKMIFKDRIGRNQLLLLILRQVRHR